MPERQPSRRRLLFTLIGAALAAIWIAVLANRDPPVIYSFEVHEALLRRELGEQLEELRITGMLVPGSLVRSEQTHEVSFQMWSLGHRDQVLVVRTTAVVPIAIRDEKTPVELWVYGRWGEGAGPAHFAAERVWVRSKWEMREPTVVRGTDGGL